MMNPTNKLFLIVGIAIVILLGVGGAYYLWPKQALPEDSVNLYSQTNQAPVSNETTNQPVNNVTNATVKNMQHLITIKTNMGTITFATYDTDAPKTVENFITLANKKFYDGVIFHRVIPGFMIQGGDPTGTGAGGPGYQFADELNPATASYQAGYAKGVVAMANAGPDTNGSQFFIMVADYPLPNNYTIFGKVVSGQDVADAISKVAANSNNLPNSKVVMEKVIVADYQSGQ